MPSNHTRGQNEQTSLDRNRGRKTLESKKPKPPKPEMKTTKSTKPTTKKGKAK
jgi:hypothetical protein